MEEMTPSLQRSAAPFSAFGTPEAHPAKGRVATAVMATLEKLFLVQRMNQVYSELRHEGDVDSLLECTLRYLNVDVDLRGGSVDQIPREGPLIVVSNHPFGLLETFLLARLLRSVRPDVKLLANAWIANIPETRDVVIPVTLFGAGQGGSNMKPLREALRWVQGGGVLGIFPSGTVAHWHPSRRAVTEPEWPPAMARLIRRSGAAVLPVAFHGRNSAVFQLIGLVHPLLRTAQIPRELFNKQNRAIGLSLGSVQPAAKLARYEDDRQLGACLRGKIDLLLYRDAKPRDRWLEGAWRRRPRADAQGEQQPIVDAGPAALMAAEIEALAPEQRLLEQDEFSVFHAAAPQVPTVLQEIGRLREMTFRQAGEGTGREVDLDDFDLHYDHLVVWDREQRQVVGAYRFGRMDEIVAARGVRGLYTRTLFRYGPSLVERMTPGIEMGRSFVRPEYQRSFAPLLLLWKGIATYISRHPRYRYLLGPVSIAAGYTRASRHLMVDYLCRCHHDPERAALVKAKLPPRFSRRHRTVHELHSWHLAENVDAVSALVAELEPDGKGVPVLLRQYLRLGGETLGFNRDPDFSDVLDCLLLVDLTRTEPRQMERYMGKAEAAAYRVRHGLG